MEHERETIERTGSKPSPDCGLLVISLDFELHWGVRDSKSLATYGRNILGVRDAVPAMLRAFERYRIHATWAVVGFLLCRSREELIGLAPRVRPEYRNTELSPYKDLSQIGANEAVDPYHYAPSLVRMILDTPNQELGTHTLSHYYCLEPGASMASFRADLELARTLASIHGTTMRSIVFPRNQYGAPYLRICRELGIETYRGNPEHAIYVPRAREGESKLRRLGRLVDSYAPLVRHASHVTRLAPDFPTNVPATRFLRPWSSASRFAEPLRLARVLGEMKSAAQNKRLYHLWWHPHNFGAYLDVNMNVLERVLQGACRLRDSHGLRSATMHEAGVGLP